MIIIKNEEHYQSLPKCHEKLRVITQLIYKTIIYAPHPFTAKQMKQLLMKIWEVEPSQPSIGRQLKILCDKKYLTYTKVRNKTWYDRHYTPTAKYLNEIKT